MVDDIDSQAQLVFVWLDFWLPSTIPTPPRGCRPHCFRDLRGDPGWSKVRNTLEGFHVKVRIPNYDKLLHASLQLSAWRQVVQLKKESSRLIFLMRSSQVWGVFFRDFLICSSCLNASIQLNATFFSLNTFGHLTFPYFTAIWRFRSATWELAPTSRDVVDGFCCRPFLCYWLAYIIFVPYTNLPFCGVVACILTKGIRNVCQVRQTPLILGTGSNSDVVRQRMPY